MLTLITALVGMMLCFEANAQTDKSSSNRYQDRAVDVIHQTYGEEIDHLKMENPEGYQKFLEDLNRMYSLQREILKLRDLNEGGVEERKIPSIQNTIQQIALTHLNPRN